MTSSIFERHPKLTLCGVVITLSLATVCGLEKIAQSFGLGKVVVYETSPVYGYRPIPNQDASRNKNTVLRFNNLGLRADTDWDLTQPQNKILFLGDSVTYGGSYIANSELFSTIAIKNLKNWQSANAGVNAWGVLNVHALVKQMDFLPADVYVSVFPEGDFYRGLMRIGGQPFWSQTPKYALEELWQYLAYKVNLKKTWSQTQTSLSKSSQTRAVELAALSIKDLNTYFDNHQKKHLLYISPSRSQMQGKTTINTEIKQALKKYNIEVVYIKDKLEERNIENIDALFHDEIHLTKAGHRVWGDIIANDIAKITSS
tara:strand:+ start:17062 stop:18006 length:945 start_codon:yes stop_codon:yes gene_type:complete